MKLIHKVFFAVASTVLATGSAFAGTRLSCHPAGKFHLQR